MLSVQELLAKYEEYLFRQGLSPVSIERKLSSVRAYLTFIQPKQKDIPNLRPAMTAYEERLAALGIKVKGTNSAWSQLLLVRLAKKALRTIKTLPSWQSTLSYTLKYRRPAWLIRYQKHPASRYLNLGLVVLFCVALGIGGYEQFNKLTAKKGRVLGLPTVAPAYLSFQGLLTDSSGNPITIETHFRFSIYNNLTASGSAKLYEEAKWVKPDQDGIFNTLIGDTTVLNKTIFRDNTDLFLGVTVNENEEMTPRQRIATVAYAFNSQYLQGYGVGTTGANVNEIPVVDSSGNLIIAAASPSLKTTSGTFKIESPTLALMAGAGSGNIGIGTSSPTQKFQINGTGTSAFVVTSSGQVGIGTASPTQKLDVNGSLNVGGTGIFNSLRVNGAFFDSGNSPGTDGLVLTSTGTGLSWANVSGSGGDAETLDSLDSTQFLRSDTGDSFTAGTLTFDSGTILNLAVGSSFEANGDLFISDTDIAFDGASTNFTTSGNFSINGSQFFLNRASGNVGIGTTNPTQKLDVNGNLNVGGTGIFATLQLSGAFYDKDSQTGTIGQVLSSTGTGVDWIDMSTTGIGGSGTINYLPKFTASTTLGNSQIYDSGSSIGIGTTSPSLGYLLDVAGNLRVGGSGNVTSSLTVGANLSVGNTANFSYLTASRPVKTDAYKNLVSAAINIGSGTNDITGILPITYGGTGIGTTPSSGQLLIGTSGSGYNLATIGVGNSLTITNGSGSITISHADTSNQSSLDNNNGVVIQDVSLDGLGHITSLGTVNLDNRYLQSANVFWLLKGDTGTPESVGVGNTAYIAGSNGLNTVVSSPDTLTVKLGGTLTELTKINLNSNNLGFYGTGNVGIGTTNPAQKLDVNGNSNVGGTGIFGSLRINGALFDNNNSPGGAGLILKSTGTGVSWSSVSDLSVGDADTLDNLDSLQFLRSDTSDNYTSGTLTFDSGTILNLAVGSSFEANGDLFISDADISFGGASTNFTTSGNFSLNGSQFFLNQASGNVGIGTTATSSYKLNIDGQINSTGLCIGGDCKTTWESIGAGYWQRVGTTLSPATITDNVATYGNVGVGTTSITAGYALDVNGNIKVGGTAYFASYVGIGTTSPGGNLHIAGGTSGTPILQIERDDATVNDNLWDFRISSGYSGINGSLLLHPITADADLNFGTDAASTIPLMTLKSNNGNVGIGTTNPTSKLHVIGNLNVSGTGIFGNTKVGGLQDAGNSLGSLNQVLTSTGTGVSWGTLTSLIGGAYEVPLTFSNGLTRTLNDIHWGGQLSELTKIDMNSNNVGFWNIGNIGVGTTSPVAKFNISSTEAIDLFRVDDNGAGDTTPFVIDQNGNVGIGTTSPSQGKLTVNGDLAVIGGNSLKLYTSTNAVSSRIYVDSAWTTFFNNADDETIFYYKVGGGYQPLIIPNSNVGIGTTGNKNKLDINGSLAVGSYAGLYSATPNGAIISGNVGIGTTSPTQKLDVVGNINVSGTGIFANTKVGGLQDSENSLGQSGYLLTSTGTGVSWAAADSLSIGNADTVDTYHVSGSTNYMAKYTSSTNLGYSSLLWDNDSSVGIGTTSPTSGYLLDVSGNLKIGGTAFFNSFVGIGTSSPTANLEIVGDATNASLKITNGYIDIPAGIKLGSNITADDLTFYLPMQWSATSSRGHYDYFTRTDTSSGSTSTYTTEAGWISNSSVNNNIPRFEKTNISHGIWLENQRRNLMQYSSFEDASTTGWTNSGLETLSAVATYRKHLSYSATLADTNATGGQAYQALTLNNAQTYPFFCHVLNTKTGSVAGTIDSSVVQLWAGGDITTTYTPVAGGWYKIEGTVTGTGGAVNYGVDVKANQQIQLDACQMESDYNVVTGNMPYSSTYIYTNGGTLRNRGEESLYYYVWRGTEGYESANSFLDAAKGTLSFWFRPEWSATQPTADLYFTQLYDSTTEKVLRLYYEVTDDKIYGEMYNGTNWTTVSVSSATQTFNAYTDHFVSFRWDNTVGATLNIDGNETSVGVGWTAQTQQINTNTLMYVGSKGTTGGRADSLISDFAIFDRSLTAAEVAQLYYKKAPIEDYQRNDMVMLQQGPNGRTYQRGNIRISGEMFSGSVYTGAVTATSYLGASAYYGLSNAANITSHLVLFLPFEGSVDGSRKETGTFTRGDSEVASTAYDVATGKLVNKNANEPRIDQGTYSNNVNYDTSYNTGNPGLYIEESRKNIALNSSFEDLTGWSAGAGCTASQTTLKVMHSSNAVNVTSTAASRYTQTLDLTSLAVGTTQQASAYVWRNETNSWGGTIDSSIASLYARTDDALTALSTTYTPLGNGWYRLTAEFSSTQAANWDIGIYLPSASRNLIVDAFQVERGGDDSSERFPTSYIPTTTSAVTRAGEILYYALPASFKSEKGGFSFWFKPGWTRNVASDTTDKYLIYIPNILRVRLDAVANDRIVIEHYNGSSWIATANTTTNTIIQYAWNHLACGWYYNYNRCRINGADVSSSTGWTPQNASGQNIYIGSDDGGNYPANAQIAAFALYDSYLEPTHQLQLYYNRAKFEDYYRTDVARLFDSASTSSLDGSLYLSGNIRAGSGGAAAPSIGFINDTDTGFYSPSLNVLGLSVGGTEQFRIDSSGNVGIGTTDTGSYKLNVAGQVNSTGYCLGGDCKSTWEAIGAGYWQRISTTLSPATYGDHITTAGNIGIGSTAAPVNSLETSGGVAIGTYAGIYTAANGNLIMSGNLGIGTTSPSQKLDIVGNLNVSGTGIFGSAKISGALFDKDYEAGNNGQILKSTGSAIDWVDISSIGIGGSGTANYLPKFLTATTLGNSQIFDNGNVGIGTTSPTAGYKLDVAGNLRVGGSGNITSSLIVGANLAVGNTANFNYLIASLPIKTDANKNLISGAININSGTNDISGILPITYGGTGIGTTPSGGQLLIGKNNGTYNLATIGVGNSLTVTNGDGSITIAHADTSNQASSDNNNGTVIQDIILDGLGHITSLEAVNLDNRYLQSAGVYWFLKGDSGTPESVGIGNTVFITGGNGLTSVVSAADTLTLAVGAGVGVSIAADTVNIDQTYAFNWTGSQSWSNTATFTNNVYLPNGIWNSSGNVGIGMTNPSQKLDINGNLNVSGTGIFTNVRISGGSPATNKVLTSVDGSGNATWSDITSVGVGGSGTVNYLPLWLNGGKTLGNSVLYQSGGNVGIGTTNPGSLLEISGTGSVTSTITSSNQQTPSLILQRGTGTDAYIDWRISNNKDTGNLDFGNKSTGTESLKVSFNINGNVGIGTTNPTQKLDVNGNLNVGGTGFFLSTKVGILLDKDSQPGNNNQILSSTGNGVDWVELSSIGIAGSGTVNYIPKFTASTTLGNSQIFDNGNVGIGTTNPSQKLDINGNINVGGSAFLGSNIRLSALTASRPLKLNANKDIIATQIDLASSNDITGILGVAYGGTNINASTAPNGSLLIGNGTGYTLSTLSQGTGISIANGAGSITIGHGDTSDQASSNNSDGVVIQDITLDDFGHLTGLASVNLDNRYLQSAAVFWLLKGDAGTPESVGIGNTAYIAGGNGLTSVVSSPDTLTLAVGAGVGVSVAADTVSVDQTYGFNWTGAQSWSNTATFTNNVYLPNGIWNSSGNVGIGMTNPSQKLDVNGNLNVGGTGFFTSTKVGILLDKDSGPGVNKQVLSSTGSGVDWVDITSIGVGGSGTTNYIPKFTASTTLGNSQIFDNGNVGIGTTSPVAGYKLDVAGNLRVGNTAYIVGNLNVGNTANFAYLTASLPLRTDANKNIVSGLINIGSGTNDITGILPIAYGGTGTGTTPSSGKLLIGKSDGTYNLANLTAGTAITIANGSGSITLNHSDTSSVTDSTNNDGIVIQSLTFDALGHTLTRATVNLDSRYIGLTTPLWFLAADSGTPYSVGVGATANILGGNGLSSSLSGNNLTLAVGAGVGVSVAADTVSVNQGYNFAWTGNQSWSGTSTFTNNLYLPGGIWNSSGNVGIGTTAPAEALDIVGGLNLSGVLQVGSAPTGLAYHQFGSGSRDEMAAITDANDVYISGDLEIDGTLYAQNISGAVSGSGTPNMIARFTGTGDTVGDSNIWDNGNVGIGTTTPTQKLDINGSLNVGGTGIFSSLRLISAFYDKNNQIGTSGQVLSSTGSAVDWVDPATLTTNYWQRTSTVLSPATYGDHITTSGNIGIGSTASPINKLDVYGRVAIGSYAGTYAAPTNGMIVSGNVGIGTTSPSAGYLLDINGSLRVGNTAYIVGNLNVGNTANFAYLTASRPVKTDANKNLVSSAINIGSGTNDITGILPIAYGGTGIGTTPSSGKLLIGQSDGTYNLANLTAGTAVTIVNGSGVITLNHTDTSSVTDSSNSDGVVIQSLTFDALGHTSTRSTVNLDNRYIGLTTPLWFLAADSGTPYSVGVGNTVNILGGNGLSSSLSSNNLTLAVGAGVGISVGANDVYVNQGYNFAWTGTQSWSGTSTFSNTVYFPGSSIWNSSGNVGIGTTNPSQKLDINGNLNVGGTGFFASTKVGILLDKDSGPGVNKQVLSSTGSGVDWVDISSIGIGGSGTVNYLPKFLTATTLGNSQIFDNGNVGIGTTNPSQKLDVNGNINVGGTGFFTSTKVGALLDTGSSTGLSGYTLISTGTGVSWVASNSVGIGTSYDAGSGLTLSANIFKWGGTLTENTTITQGNYFTKFNLTNAGDFLIEDNGVPAFFVNDSGNVGIGTSVITSNFRMDINGNLRIGGSATVTSTMTLSGLTDSRPLKLNANKDIIATQIDLASSNDITGILGVAYGGTNINGSTAPNGSLLIGNGTGYSLSPLSVGTGISIANGPGSITIGHGNTSDTASSNNSGTTVIQDITLDDFGHLIGIGTTNLSGAFELPLTFTSGLTRTDNDVHLGGATALTETTALNLGNFNFGFQGNGNVGIGTTSPTPGYKLDVVGNINVSGTGVFNTIKITGLQDAGNSLGEANMVLTSTGTGVSWATLSALPVGNAETVDGYHVSGSTNYIAKYTSATNLGYSTLLYDNGTNVGIGNSNPLALLMVGTGIGGTSQMVVTSSGYVGIGTTSSTSPLTIQGTNSDAILGNELLTDVRDRDFSGDSGNWTGTNWGIGSSVATHTAGAYNFVHTLTATPGKTYQIKVTVNTTTAGWFYVIFGGTYSSNVGETTGTLTQHTWVIVAGNTQSLRFAPNSTWTGTIDDVSVKEIAPSNALITLNGSNGATGLEIRSGGTGGDNAFIGLDAGESNISGGYDTALGTSALQSNTAGSENTAIGNAALYSNTTGVYNTAIGYWALYSNAGGGAFTGSSFNNALGAEALYSNTTGEENTAIGVDALYYNTTGSYNTALGNYALMWNETGSKNVALGNDAGLRQETGSNNVFIGYQAGYGTGAYSASGNILLGYQAGYYETSSNKLYIDNSNTRSPLIWGDFATDTLGFNGNVGVGTTSPSSGYKLDVVGNLRVGGTAYFASSVGIGTNSPTAQLHLKDGTGILIQSTTALLKLADSIGSKSLSMDNLGDLRILDSSNTPIVHFKDSGNVGIGTTDPNGKLEVSGSGQVDLVIQTLSSTQDPRLLFKEGNNIYGDIRVDTSDNVFRIYGGLTHSLSLHTGYNAVPAVFINTGNNVGIGTTNPNARVSISSSSIGNLFRIDDQADDTTPFVVNQDGNVGIGVTGTIYKLEVYGNINQAVASFTSFPSPGNWTGFNMGYSGYPKAGMFFQRNLSAGRGDIHFVNDNTADTSTVGIEDIRMTIKADGNVGIGTTSPTPGYKLDVQGNVNIGGSASISDNLAINLGVGDTVGPYKLYVGGDVLITGGTTIVQDLRLNGNQILNSSGTAAIMLSSSPTTSWSTLDAGAWQVSNTANLGQAALSVNQLMDGDIFTASSSGQTRFVIKNDGNVGIGTTNPSDHKLDVSGNLRISSTLESDFSTDSSFSTYLYIQPVNISDTVGYVNVGAFDMAGTVGARNLALNSAGGNVGIGTTNPSAQLDLYKYTASATGGPAIRLTRDYTNNDYGSAIFSGWDTTNSMDFLGFGVASDGDPLLAEKMRINRNGNVGIGTTNPTTKLFLRGTNPVLTIDTDGTGYNDAWTYYQQNGSLKAAVGYRNVNSGFTIYENGADRLVIRSGNVGIGTTNPQAKLDIGGATSTISNASGDITINSASNNISLAGDSLINLNNIYMAGNLGIGTSSPTSKLDVVGKLSIAPSGTTPDNGYNGNLTITKPAASGQFINLTHALSWVWSLGFVYNTANFAIGSGQTTDSNFISPAFMIKTDGNVGIGGTVPSAKLDVFGTIRASDSVTYYTSIRTSTGAGGNTHIDSYSGGGGTYINWYAGNNGVNIGSGAGNYGSLRAQTIFENCNVSCTALDLAELYSTNELTSFGDILMIDPNNNNLLSLASEADNAYVVGAVTTWPATTYQGEVSVNGYQEVQITPDKTFLTLTGRTQVKVSTIKGPIKKGDFINVSPLKGIGQKATTAGVTVGKALQDFPHQACTPVNSLQEIPWQKHLNDQPAYPCYQLPDGTLVGKIMVFISTSWYDPDVYLTDIGNVFTGNLDQTYEGVLNKEALASQDYQLKLVNGETVERLANFAQAAIARLKTGLLETTNLIAENILVEKKIVAPSMETTELTADGAKLTRVNSDYISPLSGNDLVIDLTSPLSNLSDLGTGDSGATSDFGTLLVKGNAEFTGNVAIGQTLEAKDASISGELYAESARIKKLRAESIEGLEAIFATMSANYIKSTENVYNNSNNVSGLEEQISSASGDLNLTDSTIATDSSELEAMASSWEITNPSDDVKIESNVSILGITTLAQTIVSGPLTQDGTLLVDNGNSINVLGGTLYLQNQGGGLDLLAGKVTIDPLGNTVFEGNLTVKATLFAGLVKPLDGSDLTIDLSHSATDSAEPASVGFGRLLARGANGETVFSLDASGSAEFKGEVAAGSFKIARDAVAAEPDIYGTIEATASAGLAKIPAGSYEVTIKSPYLKEKSLIYLTPIGSTGNQVIYLARTSPDYQTFTAAIDRALTTKDILFSWWIVN